MSPRKASVLRGGDAADLREHLIATAARLIGERGTAALTVRDIAREAQVAGGVLYNYFADKEDLLANALLAHVATVMGSAPALLPEPGTGEVADNLEQFIAGGLEVLTRVTPAFAGLVSQPKVLARFHAMVGGDPAFTGAPGDAPGSPGDAPPGSPDDAPGPPDEGPDADDGEHGRGLPDLLGTYLRGEQRLGRIAGTADLDATVILVVGAIHGQVLPRQLFSPPGTVLSIDPGVPRRLAETVLAGIGLGGSRTP